MKIWLLIGLVVAVMTMACQPNGPSVNSLDSMLAEIPAEMAANNILWFSDMERIKQKAGLSSKVNNDEFMQFIKADPAKYHARLNLLAGFAESEFSGWSRLEYWREAYGYDTWQVDQEISVQSLLKANTTRSLFSIMQGNFDKDTITGKLNNLGYQVRQYSNQEFYSIRDDNQMPRPQSGEEANLSKKFLNRLLVENHRLIAAPADDVLFPVLDVRSGKTSSLKNSLAYTRLAENLGDVLGAALIPPSQMFSQNADRTWSSLHQYDLAATGYGVDNGKRKITMIMHYADQSAAKDAAEIERRIAGHAAVNLGAGPQQLSDIFEIGKPNATLFKPDSILKLELTYKEAAPVFGWSTLVTGGELGFLVVNPKELVQARRVGGRGE